MRFDHMTIQGLLIFDPEEGDRAHGRDSQTGQLAVPRWNLALVRALASVYISDRPCTCRHADNTMPNVIHLISSCAQLPRKEVASGLVTAMGLLWAVRRMLLCQL